MNCKYCHQACIKKGIRNTIQQFYCKRCRKYQRATYLRKTLSSPEQNLLMQLTKERVGIRSMSRIFTVPCSSVLRYLKRIASYIKEPDVSEAGQVYEIDELQTYIGSNKECNRVYIMYCMNRSTRKIIGFIVGRRTKENLRKLVTKVLARNPRCIYTDRLNIYKSLIDDHIHKVRLYGTNHIERMNLTLRTHLKRLSRRTICFSKSHTVLEACLKIYFWGKVSA